MPQVPKGKVIGETYYEVTPLDAFDGLDMLESTFRLLSPSAAGVAESASVSAAIDQLMALGAANAVRSLGRSLDGRTLTTMYASKFAETTSFRPADAGPESKTPRMGRDGAKIHFAGRILEMLEWMTFCMEVNYGDFFGESGPLAKMAERMEAFARRAGAAEPPEATTESPDQSPPESGGESGE